MQMQPNQANLIQLLQRIPPKWAFGIIGLVLAYWLGQPILNRTLGWNLPTIAAMLGEGQEPSNTRVGANTRVGDERTSPRETPSNVELADSSPPAPTHKQEPKVGDFLTEVGPDRYRSPAGLFYTRGSEEGHRLKHIAKHLKDQPTRPGSHGVFDGDLNQVLFWIDEAYQKAKKGDRSARTFKEDDDSTKYEVTFDKAIGYVGGSDGKRKGNPPAKRLRIIVRGQNVITAFPF
jgi:hypothetical protein